MVQSPGVAGRPAGLGEPPSRSTGGSVRPERGQAGSFPAEGYVQGKPDGDVGGKSDCYGGSAGRWEHSGASTSSWGLGSLSLLTGSNVTHRLADMGRSLVANFSATPVESSFIEKGTLTPQEFVDAGDQLSFKFPTWQWQGSLEGQRKCSWLPPDKQYLIARSVPCYRRVREMDQALLHQEAEGGWLLPLLLESDEQQGDGEKEGLPELMQQQGAPHEGHGRTSVSSGTGASQRAWRTTDSFRHGPEERETLGDQLSKESAIPDIASLSNIDDLLQEEDDPAALKAPAYFVRNAPDAEFVAARTYDVSITYDKYFQTPRIWLFGYNENGVPLSPEEIFEDILTEYAAKTVTVDPHPCTGIPTASIHPCRHASVMKKVVDSWIERGIKPRHDLALLALLKFISSVMPTIEYDFTMDIDMFIHTVASDPLK